MNGTITWYQKALIGATGGVALVLLKLIDVSFFVESGAKEALIGYLTYATYIILGMIVAVFLSESEAHPPKQKKSCFFCGLLAPSILIAILSGPAGGGQVPPANLLNEGGDIPSLGIAAPSVETYFVPAAHQAMSRRPARPDTLGRIKTLSRRDVEPTAKEAFLHVIGRAPSKAPYVHVAAKTTDPTRALEATRRINRLLAANQRSAGLQAQVIHPANAQTYYVIIGEFGGLQHALAIKQHVRASAIQAIADVENQRNKDTALLLLEGTVVRASTLFK